MHQPEMAAHLDRKNRNGERQRDPESPGHVDQLRVGRIVERDLLGLQRHAAERAAAGANLLDVRMHRAGVDGAGKRGRFGRTRLQELFRLGGKALAAARAAEQIFLAFVGEALLGRGAFDLHAADRIDRGRVLRRLTVALCPAARGMIMSVVMAVRSFHLRQFVLPAA
jgi:hypothetical protein